MATKLVYLTALMVLVAISTVPPPAHAAATQAQVTVTVVDGDKQPISTRQVEVSVQDDRSGEKVRNIYQGQPLTIDLPNFKGHCRSYTISAHAPGYQSAVNKHVHIDEGGNIVISLMLVPHHADLDMDQAHWQNLAAEDPQLLSLLVCNGQGPQDCSFAYERMLREHPENLAGLLNISVALQQIQIGGRSAFSYYQNIGLDHSLFRDRFFAYVDKSLLLQLKADTAFKHRNRPAGDTPFTSLHGSWILHRHATSSFKEIDLDKANLQLTFEEKDTLIINGIECVRVETDIDYYKRFAHGIREVIPNMVMHKRSSPLTVFKLRWMATKKKQSNGSKIGDFAPVIGLKARQQDKTNP